MSFNGEHLHLDLHPSPLMTWFWLLIHSAALAILSILTIPLGVSLGVALGVVINLIIILRTHVLQGRVVSLIQTDQKNWCLIYANGILRDAQLSAGSFVHPYLVILNFHLMGAHFPFQRRSVIISADSVDPVSLRHLRVLLRIS